MYLVLDNLINARFRVSWHSISVTSTDILCNIYVNSSSNKSTLNRTILIYRENSLSTSIISVLSCFKRVVLSSSVRFVLYIIVSESSSCRSRLFLLLAMSIFWAVAPESIVIGMRLCGTWYRVVISLSCQINACVLRVDCAVYKFEKNCQSWTNSVCTLPNKL
jgi:hypothetical protein